MITGSHHTRAYRIILVYSICMLFGSCESKEPMHNNGEIQLTGEYHISESSGSFNDQGLVRLFPESSSFTFDFDSGRKLDVMYSWSNYLMTVSFDNVIVGATEKKITIKDGDYPCQVKLQSKAIETGLWTLSGDLSFSRGVLDPQCNITISGEAFGERLCLEIKGLTTEPERANYRNTPVVIVEDLQYGTDRVLNESGADVVATFSVSGAISGDKDYSYSINVPDGEYADVPVVDSYLFGRIVAPSNCTDANFVFDDGKSVKLSNSSEELLFFSGVSQTTFNDDYFEAEGFPVHSVKRFRVYVIGQSLYSAAQ